MKRTWFALLSALALALSCMALPEIAVAQPAGAAALPAKKISKEEAMKKYPPPDGKAYPAGQPTNPGTGGTPGFFKSPYSNRVYDCRDLGHGELVLDEGVKKVFVRP